MFTKLQRNGVFELVKHIGEHPEEVTCTFSAPGIYRVCFKHS